MRTIQLLAALALAAVSASAIARADCHLGIVGGLGIGTSQQKDIATNFDLTGSFNLNGGVGGGTAGCVWPLSGGWLGFEGDYVVANVHGAVGELPPNNGFTAETRAEQIATLRAVLGGDLSQDWAVYGTLGMAAAPTKVTVCTPAGNCASDKQTMIGFAAGLSARYAFTRALRLRLEYLYTGFANKQFAPGGVFLIRDVDLGVSQARIGLELHF